MKINIKEGKSYFFRVNIFGRELDYEGKVIFLKGDELRIKTAEDCNLKFSLKNILEIKEVEGKKLDENKIFTIRKNGPLKEVEKPIGL
jgi:hypothetical protein